MSKKSKRFRVATSGPTIDGREIKPEWLTQAAATYNPEIYAARVNVEHMRGYSVDGPFGAFGDVTALHAETDKAGRVVLYAEIEPNERAIAANRAGQKLYTSIELIPDFAGTGQAYMVGLALTDTPASLGTERLTFSAQQIDEDATYTARTFSAWGSKTQHIAFGQANPLDMAELMPQTADAAEQEGQGLADKFNALRAAVAAKFGREGKAADQLAQHMTQAIDDLAEHTASALKQLSEQITQMQAAHQQLEGSLNTLTRQLEATPAQTARPASAGGTADASSQTDV